jgi:flavodoxin
MKRFFVTAMIFCLCGLCIRAQTSGVANNHSGKVLVAYFSLSGNTRVLAEEIQKETGATLFEIKTAPDYPRNIRQLSRIGKRELNENVRPALAANVNDMASYDVVFLGYPIWWGTMPMALFTFLESYNFDEKIIVPFCTHAGSGLGSSVDDIKRPCPNSVIREGLGITGGTSWEGNGSFELGNSRARANVNREVKAWLQKIGLSGMTL